MQVFHIITGLNDGGAEAVLYRLCSHDQSNRHKVVSLTDLGKYGSMLEALAVPVITLNMRPNRPSLVAFFRLVILLRRSKPDLVQTWMYHADLFGGVAAWISGIKPVIWGIHNLTLEPGKSKASTIFISKLLAILSWFIPAGIIVCAQRAIDVHERMGYDSKKMKFIPNGYNLTEFSPRLDHKNSVRSSFLSSANIPLLGCVARFDPQKDHLNLLMALARLVGNGVDFHCLLVGTGIDFANKMLVSTIHDLGLSDKVSLLGARSDIPLIMNALDLHILPSSAEAFPNVVVESMACGTPCVVTDVGDSSSIVGSTGWVVPPSDSSALALAIDSALIMLKSNQDWASRCNHARIRVEDNYSIEAMVSAYSDAWSLFLEIQRHSEQAAFRRE